jgi:DNA-binding transcriptional ArsR family regulator
MDDPTAVLQLSDPRQMRALAHPLRLRLLGLLRSDGPATATMLGRETDSSPALVSYHLRSLAAHSLIEEAPELANDGRERWWRSMHGGMTWNPADFLDTPERAAAAGSLMSEIADRYADAAREWLADAPSWPPDWVDAADMSDWRLRLTPDATRKLRADLIEVIDRYAEAPHEEGSEFVRLIVQVLPRRARAR